MSVDFHGIPAQESIRQGLSIPSLNFVSGASLCCWFNADTLPPGPAPDDDKYSLIASSIGAPPGTTNSSRIEIEIQNTPGSGITARFNIVCRAQDSDASTTFSSANDTAPIGTRTFVVVTVDYVTRTGTIYKNGQILALGTGGSLTPGNTDNTNGKVGAIGSEDEGSLEWFDGRIEDARVYSRVLTADEVQTMYECEGVDGIVFGLQQRYELQSGFEGQAATAVSAQDSAQQQLNGSVINGSPTYRESIGPTFRRRLP